MKISALRWPAGTLDYDADLLVDMQAGTVVLLIRGRNAWHGTWVRHYLKNATLYTGVPSAKIGAENQRGPGNVFYIVEAPALLLIGERTNVVICDAHPNDPFGAFSGVSNSVHPSPLGHWVDGLFPGVSMRDAVAALRHDAGHWSGPPPAQHSLRTGVVETAQQFDTADRAMISIVSRAVGSHHRLEWNKNAAGNRYSRDGVDAVTKAWNQLVAEAVMGPAPLAARAKQLAWYREDVLKALPRSQWLQVKARADGEKREARQVAYDRWRKSVDSVAKLENALHEAEGERGEASRARLTPASSSAGLRKQRERLESAKAEVERLSTEFAEAKTASEGLRKIYDRT